MYNLTLTENDIETIFFVGNRYGWSKSLLDIGINEGENLIRESDAWKVKDGIDDDMEGNHSAFPMLDSRSDLAEKLVKFWDSIV